MQVSQLYELEHVSQGEKHGSHVLKVDDAYEPDGQLIKH